MLRRRNSSIRSSFSSAQVYFNQFQNPPAPQSTGSFPCARLTYNNRNNDTASVDNPSGRNIMFVANYDFRIVKMYFAYRDDEGLNSAPLNNSTLRPYAF